MLVSIALTKTGITLFVCATCYPAIYKHLLYNQCDVRYYLDGSYFKNIACAIDNQSKCLRYSLAILLVHSYNRFDLIFYNSCGKAAKHASYSYFCIEFYGECWGYREFDVMQPHAGARKCWGKRPNHETCIHDQENPICVGTKYHGYFYEVN